MSLPIADQNIFVKFTYHFTNVIQRGSHQFPLNLFFGLQSFAVCQWFSDFTGSIIEYPLALIQMPVGYLLKFPLSLPSRSSDFQAALNLTRYRKIHTDIV